MGMGTGAAGKTGTENAAPQPPCGRPTATHTAIEVRWTSGGRVHNWRAGCIELLSGKGRGVACVRVCVLFEAGSWNVVRVLWHVAGAFGLSRRRRYVTSRIRALFFRVSRPLPAADVISADPLPPERQ